MATTRPDHLPFLPGNTFKDPTKQRFHVSNTLGYKNGYMQPTMPHVGLGGERLYHNQISENELNELANKMPTLTYGNPKPAPPERFIPAHVAFDKKVLRFSAYFKETVTESQQEHYRVRPVDVYYYLEDDSIAIIEPKVENSGIPQGKLLKRQRLPRDDQGNNWHWKDLNVSTNLVVYGKVFRLTQCDKFTSDYLTSKGIVMNNAEAIPDDPYIMSRVEPPQRFVSKSNWDKRKRFVELDRKVLRFYLVWDDREEMFGELRPFILHYFLVDDTLEVREVHKPNDGHDPFPVLVSRQKVPKDRCDVKSTYSSITLELTEEETKNWFTPADFKVGETVLMYNRRFLLYDCDEFTKSYYRQFYGVNEFAKVDVNVPTAQLPKMELPPYNGWGTLEDSKMNCLSVAPKTPKIDFVKMLEYDKDTLRYELRKVSFKPEDQNRKFIMTYRLSDDMLSIYEKNVRNSGIIPGKFLRACRIAKPGMGAPIAGSPHQGLGDTDNPVYYSPADFSIGAVVKFNQHRFRIVNCDARVLTLLEKQAGFWPAAMLDSIRKLHANEKPLEAVSEEEKKQDTN